MTAKHLRTREEVVGFLERMGQPVSAYEDLDEPLLSTGQVALLLRTTDRTVRVWADTGKLTAFRSLGGRRMFPASAVIEAMTLMRSGLRRQDGAVKEEVVGE